jgi:DNA-binding transcriptional MerR regulator
MQIYTLPNLARALGVTYPVVYALRARGFLQPTQRNGTREYYTMEDYQRAAAKSLVRNTVIKQHSKPTQPLTTNDILKPYL